MQRTLGAATFGDLNEFERAESEYMQTNSFGDKVELLAALDARKAFTGSNLFYGDMYGGRVHEQRNE